MIEKHNKLTRGSLHCDGESPECQSLIEPGQVYYKRTSEDSFIYCPKCRPFVENNIVPDIPKEIEEPRASKDPIKNLNVGYGS